MQHRLWNCVCCSAVRIHEHPESETYNTEYNNLSS
jgi:hypothetical protein